MKTIPLLLAGLSGLALASESPAPETPPKGLAASDWSSIRAAYEAGRHAAYRQENGALTARNPGQQWRTEFDGKGFTLTPDHGQWTWGLELTGYGERTLLSASSPLTHDGGKITCQRDAHLTEWFINDTRGLEQGWTIHSRSVGSLPAIAESDGRVSPTSENLTLTLALRGDLKAHVSQDSSSVSFQTSSGGTALTYGGLKAWDVDGKILPVRFENAGGNAIRIAVEDQDARYPITIDPIAQQAYLKASNSASVDEFGYSVAISGDTVVVGARFESSNATGINGNQADNSAGTAGAAYIFVRSGTTWTQQAYLKASNTGAGDSFGESVAISGDTVVVGAYREDSSSAGVNGNQANNSWPDSGAAYVFTRNGGIWTQQAYLKASNNGVDYSGSGDYFGYAVSISGDTVVVGAMEESSDATGVNGNQANNNALKSGAAYVFTRSGSSWSQQAYLKASNTGSQDRFGFSVALHDETLIVGATGESSNATGVNGDQSNNGAPASGAAYVFTRSGGAWSQQAYLKASNTEAFDSFGCSVAISENTGAVGAAGEDSTATGVNGSGADIANHDSGAAYVFTRVGTAWSQQAYLKSSNTGVPSLGGSSSLVDTDDAFGRSIAISGDTIVVGEPGEDSGATGVDSVYNDINKTNTGAAYVFTRSGEVWSHRSYIKDNYAGFFSADDHFGWSVAVSGETMIVGAPYEASNATGVNGNEANDSAYRSGAAYIYTIRFPEIAIQQAGTDIASGATKAYGPVVTGNTSDLIFTILNTESGDLALTGTPKVAVTGSPDFTVTSQPGSPITGPGGSSDFTVRFTPTGSGLKSATLSIPNDDPDENPFTIELTGNATAPPSTNADMGSLSVTEGSISGPMLALEPAFSPAITNYQVEISQDATAVILTGLVADPSATIYAMGNMGTFGSLNVTYGFGAGDPAPYSFNVAAQDGFTFKTYTINFIRRVVPEITIEQAGSDVSNGATKAFGPVVAGTTSDLIFTILNTASGDLNLTGTPKVAVTGSGDFTVTVQPSSSITGTGGSSDFTVRFTPTGSGLEEASLSIPNNDDDENPFVINLTGTALSFSTDTDNDGLSDASEFNMAALGFNWQVDQSTLVDTLFDNAAGAGLFTTSQVQALHTGTPLIARDPATGKVKLTMDWKKSTNLSDFFDFPAPAGSSVSISPGGDVEFEFPSTDDAAFYRIELE